MCSGVTPGDHFLALREKLVLKVIYTPFTSLGILLFFPPSDITFFLFQKLFLHDCEINVSQFNLGTNTICTYTLRNQSFFAKGNLWIDRIVT
jgi:hypothetical protein